MVFPDHTHFFLLYPVQTCINECANTIGSATCKGHQCLVGTHVVISGPMYILFLFQGGIYMLEVMDTYSGGWNIMFIALCECISVGYVYGECFIYSESYIHIYIVKASL